MIKEETYSKGFNVSSLKGVNGIYLFLTTRGKVKYVGMCKDDFKNRIRSHDYGKNGKLDEDIQNIIVIKVEMEKLPCLLNVLENLLISYFKPPKNKTRQQFWNVDFNKNEKGLIHLLNDKYSLHINDSFEDFLLSFESVVLQRVYKGSKKNPKNYIKRGIVRT